jgi:hypothetical protein
MGKERPVRIKRSSKRKSGSAKNVGEKICIIHFRQNKSDTTIKPLTDKTFEKIKSVVTERQASDDELIRLDDICSLVPEKVNQDIHGVHIWCYQSFTNSSSYLKRKSCDESKIQYPSASKRSRVSEKSTLFPYECIFCGKVRKSIKGKEEQLTKCLTATAENSIKDAADRKRDENLLCKIRNVDLIAKEVCYHSTCRKAYTRARESLEESAIDDGLTKAHANAFTYICDYVKQSIVKGGNVMRMTMLREKYLQFMMDNSPEFYNPSYKTDKLKNKLLRQFQGQIQFWQPNYRSELVYSSNILKGQAVETAFELAASDERVVEDCAMMLRRNILDFKEGQSFSEWPPRASNLLSMSKNMPCLLEHFLTVLLCGKNDSTVSNKTQRLVNSFGQDLCHAVTNGRLKLPKHLLLGMTLRHMTGSAEILTLMNHFGHCQSYSQILELETAMCNSTVGRENSIPAPISPTNNIITHLCWDNFDLNEETPSGSGTTHTAHGIVIQEKADDEVADDPSESLTQPAKITRTRSVDYQPENIPECFLSNKAEPVINTSSIAVGECETVELASASDFAWFMCRKILLHDKQLVPSWSGWVSLTTGTEHLRQSVVEYLPPVNAPMTENATVQKVLQESQKVSEVVGQKYTFVTFDLAVAKKAYSITWQNPAMYKETIIHLGAFHTLASYLGALGKRLRGSGFSEIVIESGICASGSLEQVLNGKHYNRAMRVHKLTLEALERLLFVEFVARSFVDGDYQLYETAIASMQQLAECPDHDKLAEMLTYVDFVQFYQKYLEFKDNVRQGHLGKTAQFWIDYIDKVWLILTFLRATKENDLDLYVTCIQKMCPLFFAYDHQNYAKYLSVYHLTLINLESTHPGARDLLKQNGFSVSRSDIPGTRNAVDITIEQTINRHAKSRGGIIGFSRNFAAYHRWCMTRHLRASYVEATYELAEMSTTDVDRHKDNRQANKTASERDVQKVLTSIENFVNPFCVDNKDALYCISSGSPLEKESEQNILEANKIGQQAHTKFVNERLVEKTISFYAPLRKQKLKTFDDKKKRKKLTTSQKKVVEIKAERNLFGQLVMLSEQHDISLDKTLSYPLGPVPWALATADGCPVKTDKAKLMHRLEAGVDHPERPASNQVIYIFDGNAMLQAMTGLPGTFEELAKKVFESLPKCERVDFVTDTYKEDSIKSTERTRRGASDTFLIKGSKTKLPRDWKGFMCNSENKTQLIELLLTEGSKDKYAPTLQRRRIFFVSGEKCICLSSEDGVKTNAVQVHELYSSQEEADTRIMLHLKHAAEEYSNKTIIVRSPDTDVLVLLLTYVQQLDAIQVMFDTGVGNKRRLIRVNDIIQNCGAEQSKALLGLHAFTGCDTTSAFVRQGKIKPMKLLEQSENFLPVFCRMGAEVDMKETDVNLLEQFVCKLYHPNKPDYDDINKLCVDCFRQKFQPKSSNVLTNTDGIDLSLLPPCRSSLKMHIVRANYQSLIWKAALVPYATTPGPIGNGWTKDENENLTFHWTEGNILPPELLDILSAIPDDEDSQNSDDEDKGSDIDDDVEFDNYIDMIFDDDSD